MRFPLSSKNTYKDDGISVRFPDLPGCLTCGYNDDEAHAMAREVLEGFMYGLETDSEEIPPPSPLSEILKVLEDGEAAVEVQVYMPTVREAMESKAVKKTLTIPKWLNDEAEKQNIHFSHVLQEALKRNLGIERHQ